MGSLVSAPKTPRTSTQVVYVPASSTGGTTSSTTTQSSQTETASSSTADDTEETLARERVAALLQNRRGVLGTILTGFRGFLDPAAAAPRRKTLLGE